MDTFGTTLLSYLLPVLATALATLMSMALAKLIQRLGLHLTAEQDILLRSGVRSAIRGAEEWAAREMKLVPGRTIEGSEKASWVISRILADYPDMTATDVSKFIDEELANMAGVGATGYRVVGVNPLTSSSK
jgi:hypothetical protein